MRDAAGFQVVKPSGVSEYILHAGSNPPLMLWSAIKSPWRIRRCYMNAKTFLGMRGRKRLKQYSFGFTKIRSRNFLRCRFEVGITGCHCGNFAYIAVAGPGFGGMLVTNNQFFQTVSARMCTAIDPAHIT